MDRVELSAEKYEQLFGSPPDPEAGPDPELMLVLSTVTSASIWAQIRDTVDFEIPLSQPNALTRSSTLRVDVPVM